MTCCDRHGSFHFIFILLFYFSPGILIDPCHAQVGTVNGFVRDAQNGEPLAYVNIYLENTDIGTTSNDRGYYVINNISAGEYTLVFSMMGYEAVKKLISVSSDTLIGIDASLERNVLRMDEIIKTAERERFEREVEISTNTVNVRGLATLPQLAEADLFRTLQHLPGVSSQNDFSSQLYVRGGSPDQNLILLDGVTVYNPFHLGGIFSHFNVDAIKKVEFMTGGFPAEYGGRLSSVLNIINSEGNSQSYQGNGSLSLLSAKATLEGPIPHGSFLLSARRTYFDLILQNTQYDFPYYFYDFQGKVNFDLSKSHRITLSGFYGDDNLDYGSESENEDDFDVNLDWLWGNRTTSLKWRWIIQPNLFAEIWATQSHFTNTLDLALSSADQVDFNIENSITDKSLKLRFSYFGLEEHEIKFGADQSWLDFLYSINLADNALFDYHTKPLVSSAFVQDQWQATERWSIKTGLRTARYSVGNYITFSPRLSAKYKLTADLALKGAVGLYHQYLTTVYSEEQNFSFIDLWFPLKKQYDPLKATHYITGIEWWLPFDIKLKAEVYYKNMWNLLELNESGEFENEEDDFFVGNGTAWGFDLLLKRQSGRFTGWLGYSFGKTMRTINDVTFPPKYDQRHNFNGIVNIDLGKKWSAGLVYTLSSGMPYTPVLGKYAHYEWNFHHNELEYEIANREGDINSVRLPTYHRMDISLRKQWAFGNMQLAPYMQILNVYNHENVFFYFWNHDENPSKIKTVTMFPFFPTLGIDFYF